MSNKKTEGDVGWQYLSEESSNPSHKLVLEVQSNRSQLIQ